MLNLIHERDTVSSSSLSLDDVHFVPLVQLVMRIRVDYIEAYFWRVVEVGRVLPVRRTNRATDIQIDP